jgi:DNA-binding winged helix-turn-helix (wHTH) protein
MKYLFENFELDTEKLELHSAEQLVPLEPQVFALLELLIAHSDRVVGKEEINERVWGGRVVSDAALNSRVRTLRIALGDSGKTQRVIKTIRDRGFRFVAGGRHCTRVDRRSVATALVACDLPCLDVQTT